MPNQTLYDNFSQVRQYIDQEKPDLSSYVTKSELANASYASTTDLNNYLNTSNLSKTSATSYHTLWTRGLSVTSNNAIYPTYLSTSNVEGSWYSEGWVACSTLKNYVADKLNSASYVTKSELAEMGYISSIPVKYPTLTGFTIPSGATEIKFRSGGLNIDDSTYDLYPSNITYSSAASQSNRTWVGMGTLKNYVDGRIAEIESSYATTSYVVDYVAEHGGGGSTVIDENIIPKENNTYTLGDADHIYNAAYITDLITYSNGNGFYNRSDRQINIKISTDWRYVFHQNFFGPAYDNQKDLGQSSTRWKSTYTANLYANTAYLQDTSYTKSIVPAEDATYTLGGVGAIYRYAYIQTIRGLGTGFNLVIGTEPKYDFYSSTFRPRTNGNINLGSNQYKWATTYTTNLYADNIHNLIWTGTSAEYAALSDYTTYQFYLIENE